MTEKTKRKVIKMEDRLQDAKLFRVWVERDLINHFKSICYRRGLNMTDVVNDILKEYCK